MRPHTARVCAFVVVVSITCMLPTSSALGLDLVREDELYPDGYYCDQIQGEDFGFKFAVGDLDGDGFDDLAILQDPGGSWGPVSIYYGNASGQPTYGGELDWSADSVAIVDLLMDGYDDLILTYYGIVYAFWGGPTRIPHPGPASPNFQTTIIASGPRSSDAVDAGDVSGDGRPDVIVGIGTSPPSAWVLHGFDPLERSTPDGPFVAAWNDYALVRDVVGDIDGDGCPERAEATVDGGTGEPAVRVITGSDRRCTWAWGDNVDGVLGDGTTTDRHSPVQIGSNENWRALTTGQRHTIAIRGDGTLWGWGDNGSGQVGDGTTADRHAPVRIGSASDWVAVAVGTYHSLGLRTDGSIWGWGSNTYGQLGRNDVSTLTAPTRIGTRNDWKTIGAGRSCSFAIRDDGDLYGWGQNNYGQLGNGSTTNTHIHQLVPGADWIQVDGGQYHTIGLRADGSMWAWGSNGFGEVGDGTTIERHTPTRIGSTYRWATVDAGFYSHYNLALRTDGALYHWGSVGPNVPTRLGSDGDWAEISAGYLHVAAIKQDGALWAWGSNYAGQLGDGTTTAHSNPTLIDASGDWGLVCAGQAHTLALRTPDHADWQVAGVSGSSTTSWFGNQFGSAGDIDGDGHGDLFVTDPWFDGGQPQGYGYWGRVHVWLGGDPAPGDPFGLGIGETAMSADILLAGGFGAGADRFVVGGDFDGDSFGDLAVGDQLAARQCGLDGGGTNVVVCGSVTIYISDAVASSVPETRPTTDLRTRPNPFNPSASIEFAIIRPGQVEVTIFDARGQRVRALWAGTVLEDGPRELQWDGRDDDGTPVASGSYFCRLLTQDGPRVVKMTLVR